MQDQQPMQDQLRLRIAALNATIDAVVITDRNGTIEWANEALTSMTGYDLADVIGRNPREVFRSRLHSEAFYRELWKCILGGKPWRGELMNLRKDGSVYVEEQTITPVSDAGGQITHFIGVKRDLTERKLLETKYLQAQKMECVGRLAAGVAHDFNNIIMVINGTADLAAMDLAKGDPLLRDLAEIQRAGNRARDLTKQLLEFSRQQITDPRPTDLGLLVRNLRAMLTRMTGEQVDLLVSVDDDTHPVMADPTKLEQIIVNLTVNARDAMPSGGSVTITVQNAPVSPTGDEKKEKPAQVRLTVSDTGEGISEDTLAHIFEPFFTTKQPGKGTGLGLATVYGIVEQAKGSIRVHSSVGKGTCFTIDLPVATAVTTQEEPYCGIVPAPKGASVLIVEDQPALLMVTRKMLQLAGYQVHLAANGPEALSVLNGMIPIDLMLTDVVMPGMGGRDLALRAMIARPRLKVLYMTGYTDDAILGNGRLESSLNLMHKPFSAAELTSRCRSLLLTGLAGRHNDEA